MIKERLSLGPDSQVVELASNDGYLLQHFLPLGVPVLGIEPAANVAEAARKKGVPTHGRVLRHRARASGLSARARRADLIIGNNVLAQVPDLNDFVAGMEHLLKPEGVITLEFPHLQRLIEENQFDTIYHEHFSYFSLIDDRPPGRAPRSQGVRRRGAADSWRLAPRLSRPRSTSEHAPTPIGRQAARCRARALGFHEIGDLHTLRREGARAPSASCCRS